MAYPATWIFLVGHLMSASINCYPYQLLRLDCISKMTTNNFFAVTTVLLNFESAKNSVFPQSWWI